MRCNKVGMVVMLEVWVALGNGWRWNAAKGEHEKVEQMRWVRARIVSQADERCG